MIWTTSALELSGTDGAEAQVARLQRQHEHGNEAGQMKSLYSAPDVGARSGLK